jgi:Zn-dependent peptidase ImmA (M78 family)
MDTPFRAYRFETIREIADQARTKYAKNPDSIPVDVESIIEFRLGIEIVPIPNLKSSLDMEAMLAKDLSTIFIDQQSYMNPAFDSRTRFSLAHELGHYFLHRDFYEQAKFRSPEQWIEVVSNIDPTNLEWYEKHANEFAGRFLVPLTHLQREVENLDDEIRKMGKTAKENGIVDVEELSRWKASAIANLIAKKFRVSPQTIEVRIKREKIILP